METVATPFDCFGVPIEGPSLEETVARVVEKPLTWIVTANPEILLEAHRNKAYRDILTQAHLRVADGAGLVWMARLFGYKLHRVTGVDLAQRLLEAAVRHHWNVAFIGGKQDAAKKALEMQQQQLPQLRGFAHEGGIVAADGSGDEQNDEMLFQLTMTSPEVIFVALGHPKQERWIARNLSHLPHARCIIGVGGTFDYWAGHAMRAPRVMRRMGLEWCMRLLSNPTKRWKRIRDAVILFPLYAALYCIKGTSKH